MQPISRYVDLCFFGRCCLHFLALSLVDPEDGFVARFGSSLLEEVGESLVPAPVAVNDSAVADLQVAPQVEREAAQHQTVDSG